MWFCVVYSVRLLVQVGTNLSPPSPRCTNLCASCSSNRTDENRLDSVSLTLLDCAARNIMRTSILMDRRTDAIAFWKVHMQITFRKSQSFVAPRTGFALALLLIAVCE